MELDLKKVTFNSHLNHNPNCDILTYQIDINTHITFGVNVKGKDVDKIFCEYYKGENYNPDSKLKSYSKIWFNVIDIPKKYFHVYMELKKLYYENYFKQFGI